MKAVLSCPQWKAVKYVSQASRVGEEEEEEEEKEEEGEGGATKLQMS